MDHLSAFCPGKNQITVISLLNRLCLSTLSFKLTPPPFQFQGLKHTQKGYNTGGKIFIQNIMPSFINMYGSSKQTSKRKVFMKFPVIKPSFPSLGGIQGDKIERGKMDLTDTHLSQRACRGESPGNTNRASAGSPVK